VATFRELHDALAADQILRVSLFRDVIELFPMKIAGIHRIAFDDEGLKIRRGARREFHVFELAGLFRWHDLGARPNLAGALVTRGALRSGRAFTL
jgi:hypothetical protein